MAKSMLKVVTVVGTRPEIIRLSQVVRRLEEHVQHVLVHTGQNYDYELNEIFFKDLDLRPPDHYLGVNTDSLGTMMGETLVKTEQVLVKEKPDAVLILGDTNSSIAAIIAKRKRIPIYHMEAGNRCFDQNVPEEINRHIIDHTADFNLVYTERARQHLLAEGLPARRIYLTGSPLYEVLAHYRKRIEASPILADLQLTPKRYFLVSSHREENVDFPTSLSAIVRSVNALASTYDVPIIFSTHPRTRKRLGENPELKVDNRVRLLKPFGFHDYVHLQMHALCTLSDSGTISEESAILGFPAVTIRNASERPEAMDAGSIILTGLDTQTITDAVALVIAEFEQHAYRTVPAEYMVENTSWRVLKIILGTAKLSNAWAGIVR